MSTYEKYLAELAAMPVTAFATREEAHAALDEAGIMPRDYPLFMNIRQNDNDVPAVYDVRLGQAKGHVLNVNSPYNVMSVKGMHQTGLVALNRCMLGE